MAYTAQQLADVEAAIVALATGAQSYAINGRSVTRANLNDLRTLRKDMQSELGVRQIVARGVFDESGSAA